MILLLYQDEFKQKIMVTSCIYRILAFGRKAAKDKQGVNVGSWWVINLGGQRSWRARRHG
jgi:hypothetical protein